MNTVTFLETVLNYRGNEARKPSLFAVELEMKRD